MNEEEQKFPEPNSTYHSRKKSKCWTGDSIVYYEKVKGTLEPIALDGQRGFAFELPEGRMWQFTVEGYPTTDPTHSFRVFRMNLDIDAD